MSRHATVKTSLWTRAGAGGIVVGLLVGVGVAALTSLAPVPAVADNSSAVTVTSADYELDPDGAPFPDLAVTVSKTTDLVSEGILVSWTGGKKSVRPQGNVGGENFLQIAQCWGEDKDHPGHPDRTTCQYGAFPNAGRDANVNANVAPDPDKPDVAPNIAPEDEQYTSAGSGFAVPPYTSIPFQPRNGAIVASVIEKDGVLVHDTTVDVNKNEYFTEYTSNEVKWAGSDDTGTGSAKFEVQTTMQSPGLGCGEPEVADGVTSGKSCWLVVIPRPVGDSGTNEIVRPGLFWDAWQHHVAVKLDFKPVGVRCEIGSAEAQLGGSALVAGAISSWQPNLCSGATGSAFVLSTGNEADVLAKASGTAPSPLALTSFPASTTVADPLQYAPVGISGVTVSFAIDRRVKPVEGISQEYKDRETQAFTSLNLTPRLIAKLLTASYISALPPGADLTHINYIDYAHQGDNARNITSDPEFLEINDAEWAAQDLNSASLSDSMAPSGRSDLATQLWRYVMADADAVAFLDGTPDEWGMIVNPWYSTNAGINPTGAGFTLPRDNFPKADPVEKPATTGSNGVGPVNLVTWRPYTSDFENGAYLTLRGDGQQLGGWDQTSTPPKYLKTARSLVGEQGVIGLSTAASAARYQNVTASLRNPAGSFVAPTSEALLAAAAAMTPTSQQAKVLEFDPATAAAEGATTAYPLTMPIYAALNPLQTDATLRAKFANLIRYAATDGQKPGTALGQLPAGYAPMPQPWIDQALVAATAIEKGISPNTKPTPAPAPAAAVTVPVTKPAAVPAAASVTGAVAAAAATVAAATDPTATGTVAGPLLGSKTPDDPVVGPVAMAVPAGLLSGLVAAGAVPMISRLRRKRL
ncbi:MULTISPECIES: hypothetical protein [unclassified Cryobacterium]|uniref:hypothetical protein n=1 Tax=unclassified Cryobacterium TaxID=2649013 RepID=UPI00106A647F|nr:MULTISPECIES: hypothetical protein [unclassified Cryobacterium]TFC57633.1 hypothetical protein E3O60_16445 [Cryobacterium sp. TMB1-7]TFC85880.1 hypothetical protein E3T19_16065 [Cryobacterium sp. TMT4-31]